MTTAVLHCYVSHTLIRCFLLQGAQHQPYGHAQRDSMCFELQCATQPAIQRICQQHHDGICPVLKKTPGQSNQLSNWQTAIYEWMRTPAQIRQSRMTGIDPQLMIERGKYIAEMNWAVLRMLSQSIRRTNDLSDSQSATGKQG